MKFAIVFVAIILSPVLADHFLDITEACFIQYLKEKGKLSSNFEAAIEPTEECLEKLPNMVQALRTFVENLVKKAMPYESECLLGEIDYRDAVDHFITIYVVRLNKFLSENVLTLQLESSRAQLKQELESVALRCEVDVKDFLQLFNTNLGVRNETLAALQHDYCVTKFCVDTKILESEHYELNPYNISTDDVNCTYIIDIDRHNAEKEFADEYITTPETIAAKDCIMEVYRNEKRYEFFAALNVLGNVVFARKTKEADVTKVTEKLTDPSFGQSINNNCL
ncbi:hypothetical protein HA402_003535 [Bradysia odoriphaga]|nr:hypothetical protein HA402_003535 [Bradysia odoriphaga]